MIGVLLSFGFVFLVIGISTVFDKLNVFNDEGSRKFIHIGVSNWWIVAMLVFEPSDYLLAIIPPVTFIVLNYLSYRFDLIKSMERDEKSTSDLGTVWYAVSLFIVTLIAFYSASLDASHWLFNADALAIGALSILAMGYGDGLGAVLGKHIKSPKLYKQKSLVGSLTMFLATLIIGLILFPSLWYLMIVVAILVMLVELWTPKGLDNLSVPLFIFFLLMVIL